MMMVSIFTILFSFLMQGFFSNYLGYHFNSLSWFITVYPLIGLLILVPYFDNSVKRNVFIIVVGLFIDMIYTHTFIFNACLCLILYFVSSMFHFYFPYNLLTINISNLICVFLYHICTFLFLFLTKYDSYSFMILLKVLSHSILMTIIYSSFIYFVIDSLFKKFRLHEIR